MAKSDSFRNALTTGHLLHWYRIERVLGQGGFGITYLARDSNLHQEVAIKEYLPMELAVREGDNSVYPVSDGHGERFKWGLDRFLVEARTLARFRHPGIVRVLSVFEANNTAYMVMEYERGETLQELLSRRKTLRESEIDRILAPVLDGLEQMHGSGFIHRDIKPANLFLRADGSAVLIDFGSARQALGLETRTLTSIVSPGYAPYEQYYSKSDRQGPWTDIYGLAATLYRAVSGHVPPNAIDRSESILKAQRDTLVTAAEIGAGHYRRGLLEAIDHGLRFNEKDRPQTIAEWRTELYRSAPLQAPAPAPHTGVRSGSAQDVPTEIATEEAMRTRAAPSPPAAAAAGAGTRRRYLIPIAAAVLAVVAIAIGYRLPGYRQSGTQPAVSRPAVPGSPPIETAPQADVLSVRKGQAEAFAPLLPAAPTAPVAGAVAPQPVPPAAPTVPAAVPLAAAPMSPAVSPVPAAAPAAATRSVPAAPSHSAVPAAPPASATIPITPRSSPSASSVPVASTDDEVAAMLKQARADLAADRLSTPADDNALSRYQAVLKRDPGNAQARNGIAAVADRYAALAGASLDNHDLDRAQLLLDRGRAVRPEADSLNAVARRLQAAAAPAPIVAPPEPQPQATPQQAAPAPSPPPGPVPAPAPVPPPRPAVAIGFDGFQKDFARYGLSEDRLRSEVAARLGAAGYAIADPGSAAGLYATLKLRVAVNTTTGSCSYSTHLTVSADPPSPDRPSPALWDNGQSGTLQIFEVGRLNEVYLTLVDRFIREQPPAKR